MKEKSSKITDLLALLVFALFAVCVLLVLLTGAKVYQNLVHNGNAYYAQQTAAQYVATRVRQAERVTVEVFDGCDALVIWEQIDGETYLTRVYCHDGYIRELFCAENAELFPEAGEKILETESLSFSLEGSVLTAWIDSRELKLYLRSGKEVAS